MAQLLAAVLRQSRETGATSERAIRLGAKQYDGTGDPEIAWSWLVTNEEIFQVIGCTEDQIDRTLPRSYLSSRLEDPTGHFNEFLEIDLSDRRHPGSEPYLSVSGLLVKT